MADVQGNRHHDNIDRGAPVKIGGKAKTSDPAAVSDGDRVDAYFDEIGRLVVKAENADGTDVGGSEGGAGVQYTEGDTDASVTGTALMWESEDTIKVAGTTDPLPVTAQITSVAGTVPVTQSGTWDEVGINDSGNSITVDNPIISVVGSGTEATAQRVTIATDSTGVLSIDDNGGNISIDDGGNVITVDGTVAVTNADMSGAATSLAIIDDWDESDRAKVNPIAGQVGVQGASGAVSALTQRVVLATDVALPAGTNAIGKLAANDGVDIGNVDVASIAAGDNNIGNVDIVTLPGVAGTAAHASATSGNPVYVAGRASAALPTDVGADGDAAGFWLERHGAQVVTQVPHLPFFGTPYTLASKTVNATSAQTGTDIWSPASGKILVITSIQIQAYATTAGTCIVWFGLTADTTYSRGSDEAIFDGEFAPSATLKPGWSAQGMWTTGVADDELHYTTVGNISITITVWGYEV